MQQTSALYDPLRVATPSQRLAAAAHLARRQRMAAVVGEDRPIRCVSASQRSIEPDARQTAQPTRPNYGCMWFYNLVFETEWKLPQILAPRRERPPRIDEIQRACAYRYGVKVRDLMAARRTADIIMPRHIAMYLCKVLTPHSLPEIGRRFGGRDHTTTLFAIRKIAHRRTKDAVLDSDLNSIAHSLGASL